MKMQFTDEREKKAIELEPWRIRRVLIQIEVNASNGLSASHQVSSCSMDHHILCIYIRSSKNIFEKPKSRHLLQN